MKTVSKLFTAAAIAFAAVACQVIDEGQIVTRQLEVTATIAEDDESKVDYDVNNTSNTISPKWHTSDPIIGFDDKGQTFTFTVVEGGGKYATFDTGSYDSEGATKLYAIYAPGKKDTDFDGEGPAKTLSINLASQYGVLDGSAPVLMCATGTINDDKVNFQFENKTAIIGVTSFKLDGAPNATVSSMTLNGVMTKGTFAVGESGLELTATGEASSITANDGWVTNDSGVCTTSVYFAAIPSTNATLSLDAVAGETIYKKVDFVTGQTLEAGKYYHTARVLEPPVAKVTIGDAETNYYTINEAFAYANNSTNNAIITLLKDCTASNQLVLDDTKTSSIIFDLAGHKLTGPNSYTINLQGGRNLEIKDSGSNGEIYSSANAAVIYVQNSSLKITRGTIQSTDNSNSGFGIRTYGSSEINITGGKVISGTYSEQSDSYTDGNIGIYVGSGSQLTISDGEIVGNLRCIYNYGTANISGGTFSATSDATSGTSVVITEGTSATTSITDGYFSSNSQTVELFTVASNGTCNVTGGFFDRPINSNRTVQESKYYSNELNTEDTKALYPFKVSDKTRYFNVVKEGGNTYWHNSSTSAAKQANEASVNTTITPRIGRTGLAKITLNNPNHKITLDLNGNSISGQASARPFIDVQSEVEIKNGTISSQDTATVRVLKGNLTINNCIITSSLDKYTGTYFYNRGLVVNRGGNLEINESTIYASTINISLILSSGYSDDKKNNTKINGCTVISSAVGSSTSNTSSTAAVTQFTYGDTEIDGGYYYSNTTNGARVTINRASASGETSSVTATITINNGYFCNGADGGLCLRGNQLANIQGYTIKGGYFSSNPSTSYLANNIRYYPTILGTVSEDQDHPWSQQVRVNGTDYTLSGNYKVTPTSD